jgi:DNA-binding NtrC family response regulator
MDEKPKILVIDDDHIIRFACEKTLQQDGLFIDVAENGKIGLEKLESKTFDLVLLDLMMPEISGHEVLDQIQKLDPNLVVIIITGFATIESAVETLQKGAFDYIPKPFTPDELRKIVGKGLERSRLLREAEKLRREREENLKAIAAEKSRLSTIINCMGEGLIATDSDAKLILINSVACNLLMIEEPCKIGHDIRRYLNNDELENWICDTLQKAEFPQKFLNREIIFDE